MAKKMMTVMITVCLCAVLLTGCGSEKSLSVSASQLADKLAQEVGFTDQMSKTEERILYTLYDMEESAVSEAVVYMSTGATAEEIAVITVSDAGNVSKAEEAVKARVESQKEAFENYVPEELTKLSDPVIRTVGNTVILCVSNHNDKAEQIIDSVIK